MEETLRPQTPIGEEAKARLAVLLKETRTKSEFQRVLCVWLRAALHLDAAQIATAIGWRVGSVRQLHSRYLKYGEATLWGPGRGGRRNAYLTPEEEKKFLNAFSSRAFADGKAGIAEIKSAFEAKVGRAVPKSTIYRLLARQGWRKAARRTLSK